MLKVWKREEILVAKAMNMYFILTRDHAPYRSSSCSSLKYVRVNKMCTYKLKDKKLNVTLKIDYITIPPPPHWKGVHEQIAPKNMFKIDLVRQRGL